MLMPKKTRYRKRQRGRMRGKSWTGQTVAFGDYGLKTLEPGYITNRQIESARVAITRFVRRTGRLWIRIFPDETPGDRGVGALPPASHKLPVKTRFVGRFEEETG